MQRIGMQVPNIGDTLVCRNGKRYVCCKLEELHEVQQVLAEYSLLNYGGYLGTSINGEWMHWKPDLNSTTNSPEWKVVEIIPRATPEQVKESTLEFRIRVLEKENQMLTRLLMKEGKL